MSNDKKMSLIEHLKELRHRLLLCVVVVIGTTSISFFLTKYVFDFFRSRAPGIQLVYINLTEMLSTYFKVSLYLGIALALPLIMYQMLLFASPGLTPRERKNAYLFLLSGSLFFVCGVAFSYFILLPPALKFLLNFGNDIAKPMISVGSYVSVLTQLLFWTGIVFEIPLIMYFLSRLGIVNPNFFSNKRKWAIVAAFILAALITPTVDPINQTILATPIILLYEIGIWSSKLAWGRKQAQIVVAKTQP